MNRFGIVFLALSAVIAVGCSKNVDIEKQPVGEAWIYDESLPVPIQFGVSDMTVKVRSQFNNLDNLIGESFGVLAMDVQSRNVLLNGETVTCEYDEDRSMYMMGFDQNKYYPYTSENNYSFFAYYKGDNPNPLYFDSNSVRLKIAGNHWGHQDVLWARSDAEVLPVHYNSTLGEYVPAHDEVSTDAYYHGFNAAYIRYIAKPKSGDLHKYDDYLPKLDLEHVATNLRFKAVLDPRDATGFDAAPVIKSLSISGPDIYEGADLVLVDMAGGKEGYLDVTGYNTGVLTMSSLNITPTEAGVQLGEGFFIQHLAADSPIQLTVETDIQTLNFTIDRHVEFKPGFYYTFELKFFKKTGVELQVSSVAAWEDGWADSGEQPDAIVVDDNPTLNP